MKSLSEQITADGFVYDGVAASSIGFPDLKTLWLSKATVKLRYKYRDQGSSAGLYEGDFVITFENSGPVTAVTAQGGGAS